MLLNLSQAWEKADTSASNSITRQFPSLQNFLKNNVKSGKDEITCKFAIVNLLHYLN